MSIAGCKINAANLLRTETERPPRGGLSEIRSGVRFDEKGRQLRRRISGFTWREDCNLAHTLPYFDYVSFQKLPTLFFRLGVVGAGNYLRRAMNMAVWSQEINAVIEHDATLPYASDSFRCAVHFLEVFTQKLFFRFRYYPTRIGPPTSFLISGFGVIGVGTLSLARGADCLIGNLLPLAERLTIWSEICVLSVLVFSKRNAGAASCAATTKLATPTKYGSELSVKNIIRRN